jgi:hypothetical protein
VAGRHEGEGMKNDLLQHITTVRNNLVRPVIGELPKVALIGADCMRPSYDYAQGYRSELRLRVDFFCEEGSSNLFDLARENAALGLLDMLYGPCVRKLRELRASLYAGDRAGCMKIIDEIEHYMTKVE